LAECGIDAAQLASSDYVSSIAATIARNSNGRGSKSAANGNAANDSTTSSISAEEWKDRHDRVNGRLIESKMNIKTLQGDVDKLRRALQKEVIINVIVFSFIPSPFRSFLSQIRLCGLVW
jgi:hypothetical protein